MEPLLVGSAAFFIAGLVKGVLGFGFPIIVLVLLTLIVGLLDALAYIVVPTLVANLWQAAAGPYLFRILRRMWLYFAFAMTGIMVASGYITAVDVDLLTGLLGMVLVLFAVSRLLDVRLRIRRRQEPALSIVLGALNGLLTGFTGSFMMPSVIYMQALGFGKDMLVQAMGVFFGLSTVMLTVSLGRNRLITPGDAIASTVMLVPSFAGIFLGRRLRDRIDESTFQRLFLAGLLLLGSYIAWRSFLAPEYGPAADPVAGRISRHCQLPGG